MRIKALATVFTAALLAAAGSANAGVINGSFESGLSGWGTHTTGGGGSATTIGSFGGYSAKHGGKFAKVSAGSANTRQYIYQDIHLGIGDKVKGYAFFKFVDWSTYRDWAFVEIMSGNSIVATPFYRQAQSSGWTYWEFTAASAGSYRVRMGATNHRDSAYDSYAGFDWIDADHLPPPQGVSEPATMALFGLGLAGLGFARRRRATR